MIISNPEYRDFLDDISECFIQRDFAMWMNRITLPFSIITRNGPAVMETEEAVKTNFNHYLTACDVMSLSVISRRPIALEDCGDGAWLGTFETRLLANGMLATNPYTSTVLLAWNDDVVRMSSMLNGRGHHDWSGMPFDS